MRTCRRDESGTACDFNPSLLLKKERDTPWGVPSSSPYSNTECSVEATGEDERGTASSLSKCAVMVLPRGKKRKKCGRESVRGKRERKRGRKTDCDEKGCWGTKKEHRIVGDSFYYFGFILGVKNTVLLLATTGRSFPMLASLCLHLPARPYSLTSHPGGQTGKRPNAKCNAPIWRPTPDSFNSCCQ